MGTCLRPVSGESKTRLPTILCCWLKSTTLAEGGHQLAEFPNSTHIILSVTY